MIFFGKINNKSCVFVPTLDSAKERYNVLFVTCPCCGSDIGCREKIIRYEQ